MTKRGEWRLRTSLVALLALSTIATLLTLVLVGGGLFLWKLPQLRGENIASVQREAEQVASRMELLLGNMQHRLEHAAVSIALLPKDTPQAVLKVLTGSMPDHFEATYLVNDEGIVTLASTTLESEAKSADLLGSDLSANRLYRLARERGEAVWSGKFLSALSGTVTIGVAVPVGRRVLIGELPLAHLLGTVRFAARDPRSTIWVVDARGELVTETGPAPKLGPTNVLGLPMIQAALGGHPLPDVVTVRDTKFHPAVARTKLVDWNFLILQPAGLNDPNIQHGVVLVVIALMSSLLIGALIAPFVADWIAQPMGAITDWARQVTSGTQSVGRPHGPIVELNTLAVDLETMAKHLQEREDQFHAVFDTSPVPMALVDKAGEGKLIDVNDAWVKQFRRSREESIDRFPRDLRIAVDESEFAEAIGAASRINEPTEAWLQDAQQRPMLCKISTSPVVAAGRTFAIWVVEDITERERAEKQIRNALVEKEVLLKEIYHRVKNNLQVVSSLLNLQSRRMVDGETKRLLDESVNRVRSIALVHEQLYRAENLSSISLRDYVGQLTNNLMVVNRPISTRIALRADVEELFVGIETAIPFGLLVNELVSNSFRHGYPGDATRGEIVVRIWSLTDGQICLELKDDGCGLPANFDPGKGQSLGMQLVMTLAQQLRGELTWDGGQGGACFILKFKPELSVSRRMVA